MGMLNGGRLGVVCEGERDLLRFLAASSFRALKG